MIVPLEPRPERGEVRAGVIDVQPFATFEGVDDEVGDGRKHRFPADLHRPVGDHDGQHLRSGPVAVEGERVEEEAVDPLPHDGRPDGAHP